MESGDPRDARSHAKAITQVPDFGVGFVREQVAIPAARPVGGARVPSIAAFLQSILDFERRPDSANTHGLEPRSRDDLGERDPPGDRQRCVQQGERGGAIGLGAMGAVEPAALDEKIRELRSLEPLRAPVDIGDRTTLCPAKVE